MNAPDHEIAIIGAGISGIGAGVALLRHGRRDFVVFERKGDIGGVWRDNTYPGVGVDIPSHAYQFGYHLGRWSRMYAKGHEVKAYVDELADRFGVRGHVRLNSPVTGRRWNEDSHWWELTVGEEVVTARWVISAIGNFPMVREPCLPGLDTFRGQVLRSADWDHGYDLTGKRVAQIGTGASGVQLLPEIARVADHVTVHQRTPIWVMPKFDPRFGPLTRAAFRRCPGIEQALQRHITTAMRAMIAAWVEFERPSVRRPVHALTWLLRDVFYRLSVRDPELRRKLTPSYGLLCKRPSLSNAYLRTFNRPNVELVTEPIESITPRGVRTADGAEREVDALVLATGFYNAYDPEPYRAEPVRGAGGFDLATFFAEERIVCYEGVTVAGLPNTVLICGPYSLTGGTWHDIVDVSVRHAIRLMDEAGSRDATRVEVRRAAAQAWTDRVRAKLARSLLQLNSCETSNSYYFDRHGDTPFLRPTTFAEAVAAHENFPFDDYSFQRLPAAVG
ncbi:flavin-containing monooxygenase [Pseudonocardia sp. CA-107938]|uniref:flavin-containing monooxygenase n=1 Tax=Pseudonocardia sp. CA-107938 TaxID=3240021 RepID=UPI003D8F8DBD